MRANLANLRRLQETGQRVPSLEQMPEVLPEAQAYLEAYQALAERRTRTEAGSNPISFADIDAFVRLTCVEDQDEIDDLVRIVIRLDGMTLAHEHAERVKASKKRSKR